MDSKGGEMMCLAQLQPCMLQPIYPAHPLLGNAYELSRDRLGFLTHMMTRVYIVDHAGEEPN